MLLTSNLYWSIMTCFVPAYSYYVVLVFVQKQREQRLIIQPWLDCTHMLSLLLLGFVQSLAITYLPLSCSSNADKCSRPHLSTDWQHFLGVLPEQTWPNEYIGTQPPLYWALLLPEPQQSWYDRHKRKTTCQPPPLQCFVGLDHRHCKV